MKRLRTAIFGFVLLVFLGACSGDAVSPGPAEPTFTRVVAEVLTEKGCGGPTCHTLSVGGFTLGSKKVLHAQLVNQPATGAKCRPGADAGPGAPVFMRVVPGRPEESLLYLKVNQAAPCGDAMPIEGSLPADQISLVRDWIEKGAKND
jgi:hypothetical protein